MSWEDFKKKKQQNSSWQEFKEKKEKQITTNSVEETTNLPVNNRKSSENLDKSLWPENKNASTRVDVKSTQKTPQYLKKKESLWDIIQNITGIGKEKTFKFSYKNDNATKSQLVYQPLLKEDLSNSKLVYEPILKTSSTQNSLLESLSNMNNAERVNNIRAITNNEEDFNKLNLQAIQYKQSKEAQEKANKINEDIENGNYWSATGHILSGVPAKAIDSISTTMASINSIVDPKQIMLSQSDADELLKGNKILSSQYEETTANIANDFVKTASNVSGTIGAMVPSMVSNLALPGSGAIVQGINVGADAYQDTLNEDATNKTQATITGIAKGTVSGLIEKLTGGNLIGKGSLDDVATNFIANKFNGKVGQKLASKAYEMIGEIGEENLENQAGYIIDKIVNGKDITAKEWWNEASETTKNTFLTTVVLNILGLGGSTYNEVQDINSQKYLNEAKEIIRTELNNSNVLQIDSKVNALNELNNVKTIQEYSGYIKNNESALNIANQEYNLQQESTQNAQNTPNQQVMQMQQEKAQNGISEQAVKRNIINEKVNEYIGQNRNNFKSNINLSTNIVNKTNETPINYKIQNQMTIYKKARELFSTVNKKVFKNANQNIYVTNGDIRESIEKTLKNPEQRKQINENLAVFSQLDKIIENGKKISSSEFDSKGRNEYTDYEYYVSNAFIDGKPYVVEFDTRLQKGENRKQERHFRLERVYNINEVGSKTGATEVTSQIGIEPTSIITNSIPPNTKNVNGNTTSNYYMPIAEKYSESNVEKYNRYKKNILDSRAKEVNNLISYKNETIRNIENKILEKETLLNNKKDKNTKTATVLRAQIENLKTRQQRIQNLYNEKIDKVNAKTNRDKINFETRNTIKKEARENLKAEISPLTEDLTKYKDKKAGILYNRETAQRNIDDIISDKELAQAIKETIFDPIQVHQAQKTKAINQLFDKINSLNLDKTKKYDYTVEPSTISGEITEVKKHIKIDEATLAQLLIEKKITNQDLKNDYNMSNEQIEKINKTANTFTEILDDLYNKMNEEQIKYGYSPIGKLNNYFPHFFENKPDTMLGKIASYFGIDITKQDLPTEIAGKTDIFKPGKTWNSNTLQRKTNKTDYDALKAMEKYIQGATDIIYTTEDIQKIREYERQIRYQYSDKGIQESIDDILNNSELTQEAKDSAIDGVFKNSENELSNFVTWLNDYGNALANKKSFADRNMERNIGRNLYSSMSGIEARIASNTIGGNLSVSLTNFAPLFQAVGTTKINYLLTGMLQTTSNNIKGIMGNKDVTFMDNSNFLTNRFGTDTIADRTVTQKISDVASIPMNVIDEFTAESIVRGKYLENIDKGMTEEQALDNADKYASKLMADRSKGALPLIFNAKNPISKLTTMFQVEPNNIISNYLKDMPREATNKVELTKQATKLMVASYAFNTLVMAIRGGNEVLPDPVKWVSYLIKAITGDDDEKEQARTDLMESIIGSIPFASNVAGLFGFEDIGRVPISNAMPNLANIAKAFDSEADSQYKKETAMKELLKPFVYLGLPTGGAQIKKTFEGISTVSAGGSYKTDKEGNKILQFPVENPNATDYIRAGILGKYSLPMAREYQDRNFKSLSAKQTKTYEESNLPFKEYLEYVDQKLKTNEDKINYLSEKDWNENQKWGIYTNDIFSSTEREKDGGSQLSDAKYITSNGVSKSEYIKIYNKAQKNNIDMPTANEYKEMKSNGITLKNYIEYKVKVKELTESKRKSKELSSTENLKNADKIQILLDSKYSNKEISAIYTDYIKSEKDTEYDIMKATGIDIKEYLKYKQQEFESDKNDDGTLKGKTVSKSKQKKVEKYLNSMNIKGNQRLLLYAMQGYTTTSSQKTQLANYVKELKIDKNTKLKLYDKFSGFTVYKDGTVKW